MNAVLRGLLLLLGLLVLGWTVYTFRSILTYVVISVVLSYIGTPLVALFRRIHIKSWQMPAWLASLATLLSFGLVIYLVLALFAPLVQNQIDLLGSIDVRKAEQNIEETLGISEEWLASSTLSEEGRTNRQEIITRVQEALNPGRLSQVFDNIVGTLGSLLVALFSILFMTFFFLKDGYLIERIIFTLTPDKYMEQVKHILQDSNRLLTRYFLGVLAQVSIITAIVSIGLHLVGLENALIIGLLAGLLNCVPYVGPIVSMCIGLLLALTSHYGGDADMHIGTLVGLVALVYGIAQAADNFFIQPVILGNSVSAHPLEIFIVISMAGTLAGVTGMIIAIPGYTFLRIIAREFLSKFKVVESLTRGM